MGRSLVGTPVEDKTRLSELILDEYDPRYCRLPIELTAGTYEIGEVAVNATIGDSANGAGPSTSDAIILENVTVPATETWEVPALVRGPAILNLDAVVRSSDTESDADLITRLGDLTTRGVVFVREPSFNEETDRGA